MTTLSQPVTVCQLIFDEMTNGGGEISGERQREKERERETKTKKIK